MMQPVYHIVFYLDTRALRHRFSTALPYYFMSLYHRQAKKSSKKSFHALLLRIFLQLALSIVIINKKLLQSVKLYYIIKRRINITTFIRGEAYEDFFRS